MLQSRLPTRAAALVAAGLAALLAAPPLASRPPRRDLDAPRLHDHLEARAKRLAAALRALARESRGLSPSHVEGGERGVDVLTYDLSFRVDPSRRTIEGRVAIRLMAARDGIDSVPLDFAPDYEIVEVLRDGAPIAPLSREGERVVLPLSPALSREARTTVELAWRGVPPQGEALEFWSTPDGAVVTSVAEPFDARSFWPCVDDPSDRAVVTVRATVPPGYVCASAGLESVAEEPDGARTFTWRLPQPIPTYLVSLAVGPFARLETSFAAPDGRRVPVVSYVLPSTAAAASGHLAETPRHLAVLSGLFGAYPFADTKYGIVASHFQGGMEHPTMTSIGSSLLADPTRDLTDLLVHELAHQWWGDEVTMRTWDDIWLNEGFATYAEVLYRERADGVPPGLLLAAEYDDGRYSGALAPRVAADASNPFRFGGAVYLKGAWALHMLRRLVGDEPFFASLAIYRRRHALGNATRGELRQAFEEVSGRDLKGFFDQWVETPYRPVLRVLAKNVPDGSRVEVTVEQRQGHAVSHPLPAPADTAWYAFPLVVRLHALDGASADVEVPVSGRAASETYAVPNPLGRPVARVTVDPAADLLKVLEAAGVTG